MLRSVIFVLCASSLSNCEPKFRLGRSKGGNLGAPGGYNGEILPQAQWFKQKLNHFSPSDIRTWKQVGRHK